MNWYRYWFVERRPDSPELFLHVGFIRLWLSPDSRRIGGRLKTPFHECVAVESAAHDAPERAARKLLAFHHGWNGIQPRAADCIACSLSPWPSNQVITTDGWPFETPCSSDRTAVTEARIVRAEPPDFWSEEDRRDFWQGVAETPGAWPALIRR